MWICRLVAQPWPCADARLALVDGFRDRTPSLTLLLASQFVEELGDLDTIAPKLRAPPDSRVLDERFIGWVPVRRT
ncbi:hypothetical protein [Micromonospora sp. NPDC004704]